MKTALITGGAHRVGRAITLALAAAGANVVINYHSSADAAETTVALAREHGVDALAVQADVADAGQVHAMVDAATERFGGIDILVNSASLFWRTPLPVDDYADAERVIRISALGTLYTCNAVAPGMLARGDGAIVNIIDGSADAPWRGYAAHGAGKAAMQALTRSFALELAPAVRVNAVWPGPVLPPEKISERAKQRIADGTLLKRWGSADDVANAVVFLVNAPYITGETVVVDGGERWATQM